MRNSALKRIAVIGLLGGVSMFSLFGCGNRTRYDGSKGGEPVDVSKAIDVYFSYSTGTYMNSGNSYSAVLRDDGVVEVKVRQDGQAEENVPVIETDRTFLEKIDQIIEKNNVAKWNGYHLSARDVLDGDGFTLSIKMDNGQKISAGSYMAWPDGYGAFKGEMDTLFIDLYESIYPNKEKALKKYFDDEVLAGREFNPELTISYPYISAGGNRFTWGDPNVAECAVARRIAGFTKGDLYTDDPRDLMVVWLYPKKDQDDGKTKYCLRFEIYTIDDDMKITKSAEQTVDENVCMHDGINSYLFAKDVGEDRCIIGYNAQHSNKASSLEDEFLFKAYEYKDGALQTLTDLSVKLPDDRENRTVDDIADFIKAAEEYELFASKKSWESDPTYPLLKQMETAVILNSYSRSTYGSGFYNTLLSTEEGEKVGDFSISETFRGTS